MSTDGTSPGVAVGWVRVTSSVDISGQAIFQVLGQGGVLAEAGVAASPSATRMSAFVESSNVTASGLALSNPGNAPVAVTLRLRNTQGVVAATTDFTLPALGHVAQFVTQWFGSSFANFEGSLEVQAASAVAAVALRFDNAAGNVFTTLPVAVLP